MSMAAQDSVSAFVPATVANLGPGYDVLGLALAEPGDTVTARFARGPGVTLVEIRGDGGVLPRSAAENTAGIAALATLRRAGVEAGVELELTKGMPIGSGLGSSAASAAAAAFAVNLLLGSPLRRQELIEPCLAAEAAVSGRHADNVAPALLGGLILVRSVEPLDIVRLPVPDGLIVVVATPAFELSTKHARAALPAQVPLDALAANGASLAAFVSACYSGDLGLLGRSIEDRVVAPARAALVPGAAAAMRAAVEAGSLGSSISGAGPSVFALCHSPVVAKGVASALTEAFAAAGLDATTVTSPADCPGARRV